MKTPDESHPITIEPAPTRVRALFEGHEIADGDDVLVLREANYPPVYYFAREDVRMAFLRRTDKVTRCPYKGDANYFTIYRDASVVENAVWTDEAPFPAVARIANRVAFYPEYVTFERGAPVAARAEAARVDDVVRHTDSGSGASQAPHWAPNVSMPDPEKTEHDVDKPSSGLGSS